VKIQLEVDAKPHRPRLRILMRVESRGAQRRSRRSPTRASTASE
jgi:hypothetical protein